MTDIFIVLDSRRRRDSGSQDLETGNGGEA
jgi:hypothetical protein